MQSSRNITITPVTIQHGKQAGNKTDAAVHNKVLFLADADKCPMWPIHVVVWCNSHYDVINYCDVFSHEYQNLVYPNPKLSEHFRPVPASSDNGGWNVVPCRLSIPTKNSQEHIKSPTCTCTHSLTYACICTICFWNQPEVISGGLQLQKVYWGSMHPNTTTPPPPPPP